MSLYLECPRVCGTGADALDLRGMLARTLRIAQLRWLMPRVRQGVASECTFEANPARWPKILIVAHQMVLTIAAELNGYAERNFH